mmetsp:Transcript_18508/g.21362  ORF Transcript_18508/g.21362 Transcript_18508/m.21362 type:complete len:577 (-) Transcript_18508:129-1859(-)
MSISLHLQSILATTLTNTDGSHIRPTSHHVRSEGWTEVFGNESLTMNSRPNNKENEKCDFGYNWKLDDDYVSRTKNARIPYFIQNPPAIRMYQYRPAYSIQLYLRLTSTPHIIFNSPHSCNESHGQLPLLLDLNRKASVGVQASYSSLSSSHMQLDGILSYLLSVEKKKENKKNKIGFDDDEGNADESNDTMNDDIIPLSIDQKAERNSIFSQLHELNMILKCLRYGCDQTWNALYKNQCIDAHLYPYGNPDEMDPSSSGDSDNSNNSRKRKWNFISLFQIWAERIVAQKDTQLDSLGKLLYQKDYDGSVISMSDKEVNINKAMQMAGEIYSSLNWKLSQSTEMNLLDTEQLSVIDTLLFGHLAEALCDIHLVTILNEHSSLISFFQTTYETYFGKEYQVDVMKKKGVKNSSWVKWNDRMNSLNQFNRIPINDVRRKIQATLAQGKSDSGYAYQDAIKIMQSVALHCHDLQEVLADAALLRKQENAVYGADTVPKSMVGKWLHMFRMGADLKVLKEDKQTSNDDDNDDEDDMMKKNKQHLRKVMKEAKKNDELWISGVICATVIGLLASTNIGAAN